MTTLQLRLRPGRLGPALLAWLLVSCALPAASALEPGRATPGNTTAVVQAPTLTAIVSAAVLGSGEAPRTPAALAVSPTSTPDPSPASPAAGASRVASSTPPAASMPVTPCASQDCVNAHTHLWLSRPIPAESDLVNYVDRSYPYASTQNGQRDPHRGVEFFNRTGTPVVAAGSGRVVVAGPDDSVAFGPTPNFYGRLVVVELDRQYAGQPVFTLYGHLSSVNVAVGDHVEAGDLLGAVGATGVAIGAHLHFEVRVGANDYASTRNPELWLEPLPYDGRVQGVIAGRVVDSQGNPLPEVTVVIRPIATETDRPRNRYIQTYAEDSGLNGDDWLLENFAIGDVPLGLYSVSVSTTKFYEQRVTVTSGQVAWLTFVVNPPLPTLTPGPGASETAAAQASATAAAETAMLTELAPVDGSATTEPAGATSAPEATATAPPAESPTETPAP